MLWLFYMHNFFIHGCQELRNVNLKKFCILQLPTGVVLKFCEGVSKKLADHKTIF